MLKRTLVLLFCLVTPGIGHAETFARPGLYSVVVTDWLHQTIPGGDVFTCTKCKDQVQISITSGPPFENDADKAKIVALFKDREQWEAFARSLIEEAIPAPTDRYDIEVYQTGLVTHQGKNLLQLASLVLMGSLTSYDTSILSIHNNRIMKITVNYFEGAMNDEVSRQIYSFLDSIRFIE
jgi:hypothetical protein